LSARGCRSPLGLTFSLENHRLADPIGHNRAHASDHGVGSIEGAKRIRQRISAMEWA